MPGINLIIFKDGKKNKISVEKAANKTLINERFFCKPVLETNDIYLSVSKYDQYPFEKINFEDIEVYIEGKIYSSGNEEREKKIRELSDFVFSSDETSKTKTAKWLRENDGDYIIVFIRKKDSSIRIVNDILGRLPLYFFEDGKSFILSRKIEFISSLIEDADFNKIAISFYLLLGYIPSLDTLFKNIFRFPPASVLKINKNECLISSVYSFNLENKFNANKSADENALMLTEIFIRASLNRLDGEKENIVTLSGGIDSRAVASALVGENISFKAATLLHHNNSGLEDARVAEQLASIYKRDWKLFKLYPPTGKHLYELLTMKDGMNSLAVSAFLPFLELLLNEYGKNINVFTGDNGDKLILTYDKPIKNLSSEDELVEYILKENRLIEPEIVESLTKIHIDEIKQKLFRVVSNFKETDLRQKYIHFRMIEKPFKYSFEGEDRNRSFFWSVSPFWNPEFIIQTMAIPERQKKGHKIFAKFLTNLHKDAAKLKDVNLKVPITSTYGKFVLFLINDFYPNLPNGIRRYIKSKYFTGNPTVNVQSAVYKNILRQIDSNESIKEYLYISEPEKLKLLKKAEIENLFTVASLIEKYKSGNSILRKESETPFI